MSGSLTHSPADVVRRLMIAEGLGTDPSDSSSWPIYAHREPNSPDSCITVYDTQGRQDALHQVGVVTEHHGLNIRVRAAKGETGYTKARAIAIAFDTGIYLDAVTIGSSVYLIHAITRTGDVLPIGRESTSDRSIHTINAVVALRQTT